MINKKIALIASVLAIIQLVVIVGGVSSMTKEQINYTTNRLILELDMVELPSYAGKILEINFTAVTKADLLTVTMFFDGLKQQPVWQETSDFFVNTQVFIDVIAAELVPGIGHAFTILAEDTLNNTDSITRLMTIDTEDPVFTFLSLEHINADGLATVILSDDTNLHEGEYLRCNWTVTDNYFDKVYYFIDDTITDNLEYPSSASKNFGSAYFTIDLYGVTEQQFKLTLVAYDLAGNTAEHTWYIRYFKADKPVIPEEEAQRQLEEERNKRKQAAQEAGIVAIIFTIIGSAIGTFVTVDFKRKGAVQSVLDNDQMKGVDDDDFMRNEEEGEKDLKDSLTQKALDEHQKELQPPQQEPIEQSKELLKPPKKNKGLVIGLVISTSITIIAFAVGIGTMFLPLTYLLLPIIILGVGLMTLVPTIVLLLVLLYRRRVLRK